MEQENIGRKAENPLGKKISRQYQKYILDRVVLKTKARWIFTCILLSLFIQRVVTKPGFFAIAYLLGFHCLKNAILFVTPQGIPSIGEEEDDEEFYDQAEIPTWENTNDGNDEDSKPIMRKVTEFKFWEEITVPVIIAFLCSLFNIFDIPVFWPMLQVYFQYAMYAVITRQRQHMKKYGYGLADFFKKTNRQGGAA